jgi:hypothetical protein
MQMVYFTRPPIDGTALEAYIPQADICGTTALLAATASPSHQPGAGHGHGQALASRAGKPSSTVNLPLSPHLAIGWPVTLAYPQSHVAVQVLPSGMPSHDVNMPWPPGSSGLPLHPFTPATKTTQHQACDPQCFCSNVQQHCSIMVHFGNLQYDTRPKLQQQCSMIFGRWPFLTNSDAFDSMFEQRVKL